MGEKDALSTPQSHLKAEQQQGQTSSEYIGHLEDVVASLRSELERIHEERELLQQSLSMAETRIEKLLQDREVVLGRLDAAMDELNTLLRSRGKANE